MWDPRRLTTLWASTAYYRDSFTLPFYLRTTFRRVDSYLYPHIKRLFNLGPTDRASPFLGNPISENVGLNRLVNARKGSDCRSLFKCLINWNWLFSFQIPEPDLSMAGGALDQSVTELLDQADSCVLSGNFSESGDLFLSRLVAARYYCAHWSRCGAVRHAQAT
jgi:hypothetical protein